MFMRNLLYAVVGAIAWFIAAPALAQTDVTGWWRAEIVHGGESEPFYFRFGPNADGAPRVRFTIPVARMHEVAGGAYEVVGDELRLTHLGVTFTLRDGGRSFDGVFPPTFVTTTEVAVRFVRAEAQAPIPTPPPQGPAPAPTWTASVGAPVWAGLVIDGGRALFVAGDDGGVTALSPRNGAQLWQTQLGAPIRATPTLRNRRLYVATDAALVALDARNGREIWRSPFGAERSPRLEIHQEGSKFDHYSSSAAVDDRLAVVGSRDGCVYALDARTGAQRWKNCTRDLVTATPVLTRDAVYYAGFDGRAYAVARTDGSELWRYDTHHAIPRDLILAGDNIIAGSRSYDLIALNARTGAHAWTRYVWYSWIDSPPVLADGRLYVGMSDAVNVFAFDAATGARVWAAPVPGWTWPRVAVNADTVFAGVVGGGYSAPRAGGFAAIDRETGALLWLHESQRPEGAAMYGFGAGPVVRGNRVFAANLNGQVYAFDSPRR
jgi:outer membrane protein assembly factor BamB